MDRRQMLTSAGAVAAAGLTFGGLAHAEEPKKSTSPMMKDRHPMHQECIDICQRCETMCNETAQHCFTMTGPKQSEHIKAAEMALGCEEFCGLSAKLIARSCSLMKTACDACVKACEACAAECEKMKDDTQMAACAKACRECAASCRKMA